MKSLLWLVFVPLACAEPEAGADGRDGLSGSNTDPAGGDRAMDGTVTDGTTTGTMEQPSVNADGATATTQDVGAILFGDPSINETTLAPDGCGDGALADDEVCDDGNRAAGDGCTANCLGLEPGFSCAQPGRPCLVIARCGDGIVAASEQCDDANQDEGDGCSSRCRVELGSKCEGTPSECSAAECGNNVREGAEACDDGNTSPFDGCSPLCLREPNCDGLACVSDCGDGLLINEDCDDGNTLDGDGCSSACTLESGFTCTEDAVCEQMGDECILRVPVIFRDFSDAHPDFGNLACNELVLGAVSSSLGLGGLPTSSGTESSERACLSTDANLAGWYTDSSDNLTLVEELVLFDNGAGGYVNRFGAAGEQFIAVDPATEKNGGASLAACEETCVSHARNGETPMFDAPLRCEDVCRPIEQERSSLVSGELSQLQGDRNRAADAVPRDDALLAAIDADIEAVEAQIAALADDVLACEAECQADLDERVALCSATCKPCGSDATRWCIGGQSVSFDGNPLFFPVDSVTGDTANSEPAQIPAQYGYSTWPWEPDVFPGAPNHNFFFTSEVRYWFRFDANTSATLTFLGDDDVWVFLNGRLAVDLGGIHAPASGSVTIDANTGTVASSMSDGVENGLTGELQGTTGDFGLVDGNVYEISIFHAERQLSGSSFQLTLAGFEAAPSDCTAICGDGVLSFGEECDDGTNDGGYGECTPGCKLGPFCGDSIVQDAEDCDNGPGGGLGCPNCRMVTIR